MKETWKNIPEFNGKYQVDINGNVRRLYKNGTVKQITPYHKNMRGSQRLVVKLTKNGVPKEEILMQLIAKTFIGDPKPGYVPYHLNGCQLDNYVQNIAYISKQELGKLTGAKSRRQPVAKINSSGEIVEVYSSAREAARKNFMSYQTVIDRCNGKCKSAYAPDGFAYAWEDSKISIRDTLRKIELEKDHIPKTRQVVSEC